METYSSSSSSESDVYLIDEKKIDFSHLNLSTDYIEDEFCNIIKTDFKTILLNHNLLISVPISISKFHHLKTLDLSSNRLIHLPEILIHSSLTRLIVKNNLLTNESLPKSFQTKNGNLIELNLSGNKLKYFPDQVLELKSLKYLYLGSNQITGINKDIWKLQSLMHLSLGGNKISEIPESVGNLNNLKGLVLCDNLINNLPSTIAKLTNLKSLLLHKNQLKHLPRNIIGLKNLDELSIRENPLVDRFVEDITLQAPSLLELSARIVRITNIKYGPEEIPRNLMEYLDSANCCVNPKCSGVFFDNRVEHIKFVDFCGKYRVPLLQFLCSSKCIEVANKEDKVIANKTDLSNDQPGSSYMMKKVLLG